MSEVMIVCFEWEHEGIDILGVMEFNPQWTCQQHLDYWNENIKDDNDFTATVAFQRTVKATK